MGPAVGGVAWSGCGDLGDCRRRFEIFAAVERGAASVEQSDVWTADGGDLGSAAAGEWGGGIGAGSRAPRAGASDRNADADADSDSCGGASCVDAAGRAAAGRSSGALEAIRAG